ncbi:alpha/beta hydrolase fold domain-containing protein [Anaerocolumna sedimenticola]|uniref:Alpha/beta hydrolase fold domain-containing protein n=1 Tax=Anaerocolumna sedimenticola TaxID=2696063 RepID=A0A6P1TR84_9FIRM|nr:alpha/beta hydrolase [Anaerocolumna sedimenticola]QHQ62857.1 alpha/beta hydrolase fold domain-containing protein [Anaerocolumna sedimenticola]
MNRVRRMALKALTYPIDLKKNYKLQRKLFIAAHPYIKPLYKLLDKKIIFKDREIPVRIFKPNIRKEFKVLLFFHGGGWVTGNIDSYSYICANMANATGYVVVSVDYRLAPEFPFPAGAEDCYYAAKAVFTDHSIFRKTPKEVVLIGDSAGGNLAAAVSLMARDRGEFLPVKQILIYPSTYNDHSDNSPFPSILENGTGYLLTSKRIQDYMDLYITGEEDRYNPYVAPLLANDLSNQPKTLIITAEYDPLRDEGEAYGMRLIEYGNNVVIKRINDALHGFLSLPRHSVYVIQCYEIINRFLYEEI